MPSRRVASISTRSSSLGGRNRIARTRSGSKAATARPTVTATRETCTFQHQPGPETGPCSMSALWPWFALGGLGAFHGLNPAMGWLFAVALGLHRQSRSIVFLSLLPIAGGHDLSVAVAVGLLAATGLCLPRDLVRVCSGLFRRGWAAY